MSFPAARTLFFLLLNIQLLAAEEPPPEKEKPEPTATILETITVTAEKAEVALKDTSSKVSVITGEQIEKELVNDIRDLVRYEPGVYVSQDAGRLGLNGFNIRGIGGNRVLTQIDGVRAAEQFDFGPLSIHQYFVDVDTLKSVEIVRGAASSLYGSDALGGTVSFRTKDPADYTAGEEGPYLHLKSGYDTENQGAHLGFTGAWKKDRFETLLQGSYRDYEALENQGRVDALDSTRTKPNDIQAKDTQILAKAIWHSSERSLFRLSGEAFHGSSLTEAYSLQGPTDVFGIITDISQSQADDSRDRYRISLDQELRDAGNPLFDEMTWKLYLSDSETRQDTSELRETELGPITSRILRTAEIQFEQGTLGADLQLNRFWSWGTTTHRLTYGVSWDRTKFKQIRNRHDLDLDTGNPDAYQGPLVFPSRYFPNSTVDTLGVYVQGESHFLNGNLKLVPGIRYDRAELDPDINDPVYLSGIQSDEPPVPADHDAVSPKLGMLYNFADHYALSALWALGFRAPPYSEVNNGFTNLAGGYRTLANPDLDPETSDNRELSFKAFGGAGSLNLTYFQNDYDHFIELLFLGFDSQDIAQYQPQNLTEVRTRGWELAGDYYFSNHWWLKGALSDIRGEDRSTGLPLDSIEPRKVILGLNFRARSGRYGGALNGTHSAAKQREDVGNPNLFLPGPYTLVDFTLFYNFGEDFSLNLGGFNLTDATYYPWPDVNGRPASDPAIDRYSAPGRSFSLNLSYQWR